MTQADPAPTRRAPIHRRSIDTECPDITPKFDERVASSAPRQIVVSPFMRNTCHVWRDGGAAMDKIEAGWRPGLTGIPVPSAVEIRRLVQAQE